MPITPAKDKASIKSILNADPLMATLGFTAAQTFLYKNSDQTIDPTKVQIFIYNVQGEKTGNDFSHGVVYEVLLSASNAKQGSVDNGSDQIIALLHNRVIGKHRLELLDPPMALSSVNSLYQVATRFMAYETVYNKVRTAISQ